MTLDNLMDQGKGDWLWLWERQWTDSELMAITAATTVLLILIILGRQQKKWTRLVSSRKKLLSNARTEVRNKAKMAGDSEPFKQQVSEVSAKFEKTKLGGKAAGESCKESISALAVPKGQMEDEVAEQGPVRGEETESRHQTRDVVGMGTNSKEVGGLPPLLKKIIKIQAGESEGRNQTRFSLGGEVVCTTPMGIKAKSPEQMLDELAEDVVDLIAQKGKSDYPDARLLAIRKACGEIDAGRKETTVEALTEFIDAVRANCDTNEDKPGGDTAELTDAAKEIIDLLVQQ